MWESRMDKKLFCSAFFIQRYFIHKLYINEL
nr:MAG TPA: hypothetical protein [Caudoviricetes sp.]